MKKNSIFKNFQPKGSVFIYKINKIYNNLQEKKFVSGFQNKNQQFPQCETISAAIRIRFRSNSSQSARFPQ